MTDTAPRTWNMFAFLQNGMLTDVGTRPYIFAQNLSHPIVRAEVTIVGPEDPSATHWGWMPAKGDKPSMIWPQEKLYRTCFYDSPESEERGGHGRTVRLRVRPCGVEREA